MRYEDITIEGSLTETMEAWVARRHGRFVDIEMGGINGGEFAAVGYAAVDNAEAGTVDAVVLMLQRDPEAGPDRGRARGRDAVAQSATEPPADLHNSAPTRFQDIGGVRLAYRRFGKEGATPVVLLQHFAGTMNNANPIHTNRLAQDRPVILVDYRGVGRSEGQTPDTVPPGVATRMAELDAGTTPSALIAATGGLRAAICLSFRNPASSHERSPSGTLLFPRRRQAPPAARCAR